MTTLKTKIKAAEDKFLSNPYRRQGDQELERKELVDVRITSIIDYLGIAIDFIMGVLDDQQKTIEQLEAQLKPKKKEKP